MTSSASDVSAENLSKPVIAAAFRAAVLAVCPTHEDIASALELPRGTFDSYQHGLRRVPATARRRFAALLRAHAKRLEEAAAELEHIGAE